MATLREKQDILVYERFMTFRTPPVFYQHPEQIDGPIASGTFFRVEQRMFFITALHTITEFGYKPEQFLIPNKPYSDDFISLGNCALIKPSEYKYDACVLEILDLDAKQKIASGGWQFLSLDNVLDPDKAIDFVLFGFPYAIKNEGKVSKLYKSICAYADRKAAPDDYPDRLPGGTDLFFEYGTIADDHEGNEVEAPKLPGASGGSVWALPPRSPVWMPPRVVGVQTSYLKGNYFRAVDWRVVAKILALTDAALANEIVSRFQTNS
ncbi:hypothetical protein [Bradyrhizobium sp. SYSU BS000235]|uniref:hypothetical protein n=1 Tax=Bradyrhizobium sp. SYSU BS000235 TaxID=3411332 RepID=UPI003C71FA2D